MDSLPSDTLSTSGVGVEVEADIIELEDLTCTLMEKTGFMSYIKTQVLQFVEENGSFTHNEVTVIPERVNPTLMSNIYEYLKWIGMESTCTHLLAEAPIQVSTDASNDTEPVLLKIFKAVATAPLDKPDLPNGHIDHAASLHQKNINSTYEVPTNKEVENVSKVSVEERSENSLKSDETEKTEDITVDSNPEDVPNANTITRFCLPGEGIPPTADASAASSEPVETKPGTKQLDNSVSSGQSTEKDKQPYVRGDSISASSSGGRPVQPTTDKPSVPDAVRPSEDVEAEGSVMSSIMDDSELMSDLSMYQSTEDVSVPSNVTGLSSAEYQVNLK